VAVDSLTWEGRLPVEDFESTALGAHESTDWRATDAPAFGNYLALFNKNVGRELEGSSCLDDIGCILAA
jgi:hypothetical protein